MRRVNRALNPKLSERAFAVREGRSTLKRAFLYPRTEDFNVHLLFHWPDGDIQADAFLCTLTDFGDRHATEKLAPFIHQ
jgi:hypothetical protein